MSLGDVTLRRQQCRPEHLDHVNAISTNPSHRIDFKHPAYPAGSDSFLILYAFDHPDGGLHYNTAKVACGIIAGNNWEGSFRKEVNGPNLPFGDDEVMPAGQYSLWLPGYRYDINNRILLRRDLHHSFDREKKFVFVPKKPSSNESNMVVHLVGYSREYGELYHNTLTRTLDTIPREYLFARFAWAIFPKVEVFLLSHTERLLNTAPSICRMFTPSECDKLAVARNKRGGTGSPRKRQKPETTDDQAEDQDGVGEMDSNERPKKRIKSQQPTKSGQAIASTNPTIPDQLVSKESYLDWQRMRQLVRDALEKERCRSDPGGEWEDNLVWAMEIIRNEHSAKTLQAWDDLDEARRILGMLDDSRDWVEHEDRFGCPDRSP
ncbi:MAG: hypothetical protein Q9211_001225 [Gyalolechia sp. 1 TL-2023]